MTEESMQQALRQAARARGWLEYHTHDSRKSTAGFPDLILLRPPVMIVWELKVRRNNVSTEQAQWLQAFKDLGWPLVSVVRGGGPLMAENEITYDQALDLLERWS